MSRHLYTAVALLSYAYKSILRVKPLAVSVCFSSCDVFRDREYATYGVPFCMSNIRRTTAVSNSLDIILVSDRILLLGRIPTVVSYIQDTRGYSAFIFVRYGIQLGILNDMST